MLSLQKYMICAEDLGKDNFEDPNRGKVNKVVPAGAWENVCLASGVLNSSYLSLVKEYINA